MINVNRNVVHPVNVDVERFEAERRDCIIEEQIPHPWCLTAIVEAKIFVRESSVDETFRLLKAELEVTFPAEKVRFASM